MKNNVHYIYLASYLKETVTDSQIIGWLKLFEKKEIVFDLIIIPTGVKSYFKEYKYRRKKMNESAKNISGQIRQILTVKSASLFGNIITFLNLMFFLSKDFILRNSIIIQTRSDSYLLALKWIRKIYPNTHIIYELRGATAEEWFLSHKQDQEAENNYLRQLGNQNNFINLSDRVFFVSNKLKEYYLDKNKKLSENEISVIPGCADENRFFFDAKIRNEIRDQLNIDDEIVLVYSGALDKAWQIPEFLFRTFSKLCNENPKLYLMCLTPNKKIAEKQMRKFDIPKEKIFADYVRYENLNDYLCAADIGLLFREDTMTNNVASPTKFAEYILCGLPVIISENIGDFSDFVKKNKIGLTIDNMSKNLLKQINGFLANFIPDRDRISEIGKMNFSKSLYLDKIVNIYKNLAE